MSAIIVEHDTQRKIDYVTLNRPDQLNSLNTQMVNELLAYFMELENKDLINKSDIDTRVVVLKGNGRAFCAGLDLNEGGMLDVDGIQFFNFQRRISHLIMLIKRIKQPVICLTHGAVCGGGLALALASDIRLGTTDAKYNVAMAKIGLTGGDIGISYFLPRIVGPSMASEMMMTGKFLSAQRAYELGMLSSISKNVEEMRVKGDELVHLMVDTMAPLPLVLTKEVITVSLNAPNLETMVAMEDRQQIMSLKDPIFPEYVVRGFGKQKAKL